MALWHAGTVMLIPGSAANRRFVCFCFLMAVCGVFSARAQANHLANTTILIVRHAEKPASGPALTPEGVARAQSYARYFHPFVTGGERLEPDTLVAGSDTADSVRPRLTLEPLSRATGIPLDMRFATNGPDRLVQAFKEEQHGNCVLIAWRHKKIAALLKAFGADPSTLLPEGTWPDQVYDWVILLHFDTAGRIDQQQRIVEPTPLP